MLDAVALVSFYQEGAYWSLGVLLLLLMGSSALVQAFSWLWYSDPDSDPRHTRVEKWPSRGTLRLLHLLQLGVYLRHAGVVEASLCSSGVGDPAGVAVSLSHDLSMLRLFEAFSESAPQLVLMLAITLRSGELDPVTVLKAVGSASAVAFSVTMYHRSLRSFLPDKEKQRAASSALHFLWNLLLVSSRLAALALFASALPCFIFAHFLCSWALLLLAAWRSQTDFMDGPGGERLYRGAVALVWYFDWFNVAEGRTRRRALLYHGYALADVSALCGLWCWTVSARPPRFEIPPRSAVVVAVAVVAAYVLGLLLKMVYYKWFHPNVAKDELRGVADDTDCRARPEADGEVPRVRFHGVPEAFGLRSDGDVTDRGGPSAAAPDATRCNKRMRKLAENFYS